LADTASLLLLLSVSNGLALDCERLQISDHARTTRVDVTKAVSERFDAL
jgi:hypothetical protein